MSILGYHITPTLKSSTCFLYLYSHTCNMTEFHHEDPYYPAVVANEWIEVEPEEVHEEKPKVGPKEYQEMDYDGEDSNEDLNVDEGAGETLSEPYPSGAMPNHPLEKEVLTDRLPPKPQTLEESRVSSANQKPKKN